MSIGLVNISIIWVNIHAISVISMDSIIPSLSESTFDLHWYWYQVYQWSESSRISQVESFYLIESIPFDVSFPRLKPLTLMNLSHLLSQLIGSGFNHSISLSLHLISLMILNDSIFYVPQMESILYLNDGFRYLKYESIFDLLIEWIVISIIEWLTISIETYLISGWVIHSSITFDLGIE